MVFLLRKMPLLPAILSHGPVQFSGTSILALLGTVLTVGRGNGGRLLGILLGLLAALFYATYIFIGSRVAQEVHAFASATTILLSATVVFAGITAFHHPVVPRTPAGWGAVVALALISTVLALVAFFAGLKRLGPTTSSLISALEPAITIAASSIFLGVQINGWQGLGGMMILTSVILLVRNRKT